MSIAITSVKDPIECAPADFVDKDEGDNLRNEPRPEENLLKSGSAMGREIGVVVNDRSPDNCPVDVEKSSPGPARIHLSRRPHLGEKLTAPMVRGSKGL